MLKGKARTIVIIIAVIGVIWLLQTANKPQSSGNKSVEGGQLTLHTSEFPKSFNAVISTTADAAAVFRLVYDRLIEHDPNTLEYKPLIAESWTISDDKKEFTFKLDPRAKWSDGKAITAEDVRFTYDTIMNPKNMASVARLFMGRFNPPQVIDSHTIKFTAKTVHFNNLENFAVEFNILPKHLMAGKDFNKDFNMSLPGSSGPYQLTEVKEGRYFILTRRKDYWADQLPHHKGTYNFAKVKYKIMDPNVAFESFKRGDFDIYDEITAKRWATETNSEPFQKNWILKKKVYNSIPRGFGGLALNFRKPVFKDIKVRQALVHLFDRKTIISKLMYNDYRPLNSYEQSFFGENANPEYVYDPVIAKRLLSEAGYQKLDQEGYLVNASGQRLEFSVIYALEESEKYLTLFAESCKKAGVKVNLQRMSWATMVKQMEEYKFDALELAWSADFSPDMEQLWHSKHMAEVGGSNLCGYQNPEVDRLIESMVPVFDRNQRLQMIKKIDQIIYRDVPYVLYWSSDNAKIFYKNIFGMPKTVFPKYTAGIVKYWWYDPVKVKKYQEAVKNRRALPEEPVEVHYDEMVKK